MKRAIRFLRRYTSSAPSPSMLLFIKNDDTSAAVFSSAHETKIKAVTHSSIQSIWLTIFTLLHYFLDPITYTFRPFIFTFAVLGIPCTLHYI